MTPFDPTLLEIFAVEQTEHLVRLRTLVESLRTGPPEDHAAVFEEALRRAHTLKGAARAVGLEQTEAVAHRLESVLASARESRQALDVEALQSVHRMLDAAEDVLAFARGQRSKPDISGALGATAPVVSAHPHEPGPPDSAVEPLVRVNASYIDELIRSSSQLLVAATVGANTRNRSEAHAQGMEEAWREWEGLRREAVPYLRQVREDPAFEPVLACIDFIHDRLRKLSTGARVTATVEQNRAWELRQRSAELHQSALQVRMTPAESVFGAFGAMVRELGEAEGKPVDFRADGMDIQADRVVLQALKDPVMHLLRNAVSHGIESPAERVAEGKPATGTVRLSLETRGNRLRLVVEDDGRGINLREIALEAEKQGLVLGHSDSRLEQEELKQLIFRPGFSTARDLTRLAGRGMGLSVVEQAVARLQGEVRVVPAGGPGTAIAIWVALSISTQHVILLMAGGQCFGVPARFIRRLCRTSNIENVNGRQAILVDGAPVPLLRLANLLDLPDAGDGNSNEANFVSVAVVESAGERAGLCVDRFLDDREAVVHDLGLFDTELGVSAGGIPLEDGSVAIILNVGVLLERSYERGIPPTLQVQSGEPAKAVFRILVVDDSITTRSLERSILEAHGYSVKVAVDGVDALEKLHEERPDLVITDLVMPRMTGLQLLEQMKTQKELADIPVVIVSSMENTEDQARGLALGADAYIVKRKFDQHELLQTIRQIL